MPDSPSHSIHTGGSVEGSDLVTGSQNIIVQAEQVPWTAAQAAQQKGHDPARILRILAILAAPVYDPQQPQHLPPPLDLQQEWHELAQVVRESRAPILLARIVPPTLDFLRRALSPRAEDQAFFPHILHFSGHAWKGGLLLEDELGKVHRATTEEILDALRGLPRPLDLVVLNGCESAADARPVAQALVEAGLARAAVGHTRPVYDPQAVRFAARLYAELTDGFPLKEAVERARRAAKATAEVTVTFRGENLCFECFTGGEPWIDDRRPPGNLPSRPGLFFGRGPQLVEIAEALAHPPGVVVLSALPAIGKTSLALEAAHRNAWRFSGGVAFAEGPRPEENHPSAADDLFNRLAEALGIRPEPGKVAEALALYTDRQPTLLILDSLESLPDPELRRVRAFLVRLGGESAAIVLARPPHLPLEDLHWSAWLLEERGQLGAWQALLLFPSGVAPEPLLRAAAGEKGPDALRDAALADFAPGLQAWRWHATVGEYVRRHWPLDDDERRARLGALLPKWEEWLADLPPETPEAAARLEVQRANLEAALEEATRLPQEPLRALLQALHQALPAPDRTLTLRAFEEQVYRTWAERATEDAERAAALNMLGYTLSALGRREGALEAYEEAVRALVPFFLRLPAAFADWMSMMVRNYREACQALGRAPDEELLGPIREHLEG